MAAKTPAERAIADVEKAIKDSDKALEKAEAAQAKANELIGTANRAEKTLRWVASHPDLPDDFNLDEFRRSLEAPFEETDLEPIIEEHQKAVGELVADVEVVDDAADEQDRPELHVGEIDAADEDDPWAGEN